MIFFVLSQSYHGSTLLSLLLNNHSEILSLGDTNPARHFDQICSCGQSVSSCEFWDTVRKGTGYDPHHTNYDRMMRKKPDGMNPVSAVLCALVARHVPGGQGIWKLIGNRADIFKKEYQDFMDTCQQWHPHRIFVDGEKNIMKYCMLASMGFPVGGVIHVTRDPRGFVASAMKYKRYETVEQAARDWMRYHKRTMLFSRLFSPGRVFNLRYEDMANWSDYDSGPLCEFLGVKEQDGMNAPVQYAQKHHLLGNKMLLKFDGTVKIDEKWRQLLSNEEKQQIETITSPLMGKFGYTDKIA